jgi:tetracycline resistance efflux pump
MDATVFGALCLVPPFIVILVAVISKRAFEPLLLGSFCGYLMINWVQFPQIKEELLKLNPQNSDSFFALVFKNSFSNFTDAVTKAIKDDSMVWIILVCGMYGAVIELLVRSGSTMAFGNYVTKFIKNKKQALLASWAVGGLMFLDDYMSALSVGNTMKSVTDRFKISRFSLAYLVNTMAAPVCVIVPLSTWSIYSGKIIAKELGGDESRWFDAYWNTIPFVLYAWVSVIIALFFALGFFPKTKAISEFEENEVKIAPKADEKTSNARYFDFFIPLVVIVAATVLLEIDALKGIYVGLAFTILYYWARKLMTYDQIFAGGFEGFKSMIFPLAILTVTYVLKDVGDKMGLTTYVIDGIKHGIAEKYIYKEYLAALIFLALAFISYTTASSWGLYLVAIPIVIPLAQSTGANVWLCVGAVIASGSFGSNASLYSDCTVLTSDSCEVNSVKHSVSQLPYALVSVAIATILYIILGKTL